MLAYVVLFLISLTVAATAVWLYRLVASWQDSSQVTVANPGTTTKRWLKAQQSFNSLASSTRRDAKFVTLPKSSGGIKAPWGW